MDDTAIDTLVSILSKTINEISDGEEKRKLQKSKEFLEKLKNIPDIKEVRGLGLMIGIEMNKPIGDLRRKLLFQEKVFTGASGTNIIRLLPPLSLSKQDADLFLMRFKKALNSLE